MRRCMCLVMIFSYRLTYNLVAHKIDKHSTMKCVYSSVIVILIATTDVWCEFDVNNGADRQSLFCCCTTSMEQATNRAETVAIDGLISSLSENISVSFCLRAPGYGLTLWCALGLLVRGAIQVPQLQLCMSVCLSVSVCTAMYVCVSVCVCVGVPSRLRDFCYCH